MTSPKNQHYVPRFMLRNFLSNKKKEQVSVYDKHTDRVFPTSIDNIMAENRFNDFKFDGRSISFEPIVERMENMVLPFYRRIIETRRLMRNPEESAALAFLFAFQFMRTKASRYRLKDAHEQFTKKLKGMGIQVEQVEGWAPPTEEQIKQFDLMAYSDHLPAFTEALGNKIYHLTEAAPGRSFYLGDNPVSLNNSRPADGFCSNIGLAVPGIEIYLPLSSDLLLAAWCPTILAEIRHNNNSLRMKARNALLGALLAQQITADMMKNELSKLAELRSPIDELLTMIDEGKPHKADDDNMDFYNSMQSANAYRYVICQGADFTLAKKHNRAFPELRAGQRMKIL